MRPVIDRRGARVIPVVLAALLALSCGTVPAASSNEGTVELDVPYVQTPQRVVDRMLAFARPTKNDVVYDLGSGDGRIVIRAARRYGSRGVGIDIDPARVEEGTRNAQRAGVSDRVRFVQQDVFEADVREATVVTMYLLQSVNERLRPRLLEQLRPGARIVSHQFDLGEWEADESVQVARGDGFSATVYYWVVPAKVAGTWDVTLGQGDQARRVRLNLEQKYQKVRGSATVDGRQVPVEDARLVGDRITLTLPGDAAGGARQLTLTGRVDGDRMVALAPGGRAGQSGADPTRGAGGDGGALAWTATRVGS
jgi:SAM-dependent methyltransferase